MCGYHFQEQEREATVLVYALPEVRLLAVNIFTNTVSPHSVYLDREQKGGTVVLEMKALVLTNRIVDYLHVRVVEKTMELMKYNLNLYVELEEKYPFSAWK